MGCLYVPKIYIYIYPLCGRPIIVYVILGKWFSVSFRIGYVVLLWFFLSCCFVTELIFSLVSKHGEDFRLDHVYRSSSEGSEISFSVLVHYFHPNQLGAGRVVL